MLGNLSDKFDSALRKLSGPAKISEANVRASMEEVREALLEADVHYEVAEDFCDRVLKQAVGTEVLQAVRPGEQMIKIVNDELVRLLGGEEAVNANSSGDLSGVDGPIMFVSPGPTVVMMAGLQGSGKTTTCGKLAGWLKKQGKSVMLCAADLQRPAAVTRLQVLSEQVEAEVEGQGSIHLLEGRVVALAHHVVTPEMETDFDRLVDEQILQSVERCLVLGSRVLLLQA